MPRDTTKGGACLECCPVSTTEPLQTIGACVQRGQVAQRRSLTADISRGVMGHTYASYVLTKLSAQSAGAGDKLVEKIEAIRVHVTSSRSI